MSLSISLLPELDRAFGSRRKCLERLPDDECADQPHAQSMKLGQRANHVAQMPVWGATTIRTTELDVALPFERPKPETTTELLAIFDQTAQGYGEALESAPDEDLMAAWWLPGSGGTVFLTMPRTGVLGRMVMHHLVHHRGQMRVQTRMLDISVPSIDVPSADERNRNNARKSSRLV